MANTFTANGSNRLYDYLEDWVGDGLARGSGSSTAKAEYNSISNKDALVTGSFSGGTYVHSKTGYVIGAFAVQNNGQYVNYSYVRPSSEAAPKGFRLGSVTLTITDDKLYMSYNSSTGKTGVYDYMYRDPAGILRITSAPSGARASVTRR